MQPAATAAATIVAAAFANIATAAAPLATAALAATPLAATPLAAAALAATAVVAPLSIDALPARCAAASACDPGSRRAGARGRVAECKASGVPATWQRERD